MKYLVRKRKRKVAHIWSGTDTACKMYSSNCWSKDKFLVLDKPGNLPVCHMCKTVSERTPAKTSVKEAINKIREERGNYFQRQGVDMIGMFDAFGVLCAALSNAPQCEYVEIPPSPDRKCEICKGKGAIYRIDVTGRVESVCPLCSGSGEEK